MYTLIHPPSYSIKASNMKRNGERDSINLANVLMLLSRSGGEDMHAAAAAAAAAMSPTSSSATSNCSGRGGGGGRVFECKTCSRQFPSFQALGGHRASHKKLRISDHVDADQAGGQQIKQGAILTEQKPKVHECSICGLEFAMGQALGGHMRRHRTGAAEELLAGDHGRFVEKKSTSNGKRVMLDLNQLPPLEEEGEGMKLGVGLGLGLGLGVGLVCR